MLIGISTQAHIVNVCPHFGLAGNLFLHKGPPSRYITFYSSSLEIGQEYLQNTEGHDLLAENTAFRRDKGE